MVIVLLEKKIHKDLKSKMNLEIFPVDKLEFSFRIHLNISGKRLHIHCSQSR